MTVDTSALLAILLKEPDWETFFNALNEAPLRVMAAPNWLEACLVFDNRIDRGNQYAHQRLDTTVAAMGVEIVPFDGGMAEIARFAHHRYGRGSKHGAKLNFGDCIAYAVAKARREPLLFKGGDFSKTDITPALA